MSNAKISRLKNPSPLEPVVKLRGCDRLSNRKVLLRTGLSWRKWTEYYKRLQNQESFPYFCKSNQTAVAGTGSNDLKSSKKVTDAHQKKREAKFYQPPLQKVRKKETLNLFVTIFGSDSETESALEDWLSTNDFQDVILAEANDKSIPNQCPFLTNAPIPNEHSQQNESIEASSLQGFNSVCDRSPSIPEPESPINQLSNSNEPPVDAEATPEVDSPMSPSIRKPESPANQLSNSNKPPADAEATPVVDSPMSPSIGKPESPTNQLSNSNEPPVDAEATPEVDSPISPGLKCKHLSSHETDIGSRELLCQDEESHIVDYPVLIGQTEMSPSHDIATTPPKDGNNNPVDLLKPSLDPSTDDMPPIATACDVPATYPSQHSTEQGLSENSKASLMKIPTSYYLMDKTPLLQNFENGLIVKVHEEYRLWAEKISKSHGDFINNLKHSIIVIQNIKHVSLNERDKMLSQIQNHERVSVCKLLSRIFTPVSRHESFPLFVLFFTLRSYQLLFTDFNKNEALSKLNKLKSDLKVLKFGILFCLTRSVFCDNTTRLLTAILKNDTFVKSCSRIWQVMEASISHQHKLNGTNSHTNLTHVDPHIVPSAPPQNNEETVPSLVLPVSRNFPPESSTSDCDPLLSLNSEQSVSVSGSSLKLSDIQNSDTSKTPSREEPVSETSFSTEGELIWKGTTRQPDKQFSKQSFVNQEDVQRRLASRGILVHPSATQEYNNTTESSLLERDFSMNTSAQSIMQLSMPLNTPKAEQKENFPINIPDRLMDDATDSVPYLDSRQLPLIQVPSQPLPLQESISSNFQDISNGRNSSWHQIPAGNGLVPPNKTCSSSFPSEADARILKILLSRREIEAPKKKTLKNKVPAYNRKRQAVNVLVTPNQEPSLSRNTLHGHFLQSSNASGQIAPSAPPATFQNSFNFQQYPTKFNIHLPQQLPCATRQTLQPHHNSQAQWGFQFQKQVIPQTVYNGGSTSCALTAGSSQSCPSNASGNSIVATVSNRSFPDMNFQSGQHGLPKYNRKTRALSHKWAPQTSPYPAPKPVKETPTTSQLHKTANKRNFIYVELQSNFPVTLNYLQPSSRQLEKEAKGGKLARDLPRCDESTVKSTNFQAAPSTSNPINDDQSISYPVSQKEEGKRSVLNMPTVLSTYPPTSNGSMPVETTNTEAALATSNLINGNNLNLERGSLVDKTFNVTGPDGKPFVFHVKSAEHLNDISLRPGIPARKRPRVKYTKCRPPDQIKRNPSLGKFMKRRIIEPSPLINSVQLLSPELSEDGSSTSDPVLNIDSPPTSVESCLSKMSDDKSDETNKPIAEGDVEMLDAPRQISPDTLGKNIVLETEKGHREKDAQVKVLPLIPEKNLVEEGPLNGNSASVGTLSLSSSSNDKDNPNQPINRCVSVSSSAASFFASFKDSSLVEGDAEVNNPNESSAQCKSGLEGAAKHILPAFVERPTFVLGKHRKTLKNSDLMPLRQTREYRVINDVESALKIRLELKEFDNHRKVDKSCKIGTGRRASDATTAISSSSASDKKICDVRTYLKTNSDQEIEDELIEIFLEQEGCENDRCLDHKTLVGKSKAYFEKFPNHAHIVSLLETRLKSSGNQDSVVNCPKKRRASTGEDLVSRASSLKKDTRKQTKECSNGSCKKVIVGVNNPCVGCYKVFYCSSTCRDAHFLQGHCNDCERDNIF